MYYTTIAEYDAAIEDVKRAIAATLKSRSYTLTKAGVSVSRTSHELADLYKLLNVLQGEREALAGGEHSGRFALAGNVRRFRG